MKSTKTNLLSIREFVTSYGFNVIDYKRGGTFQNISNYKLTLEKEGVKKFINILSTPELVLSQLQKEING